MVNGVVDRLHDLPLPVGVLLPPVQHVVDVHGAAEVPRPKPLDEHRVGALKMYNKHCGVFEEFHL